MADKSKSKKLDLNIEDIIHDVLSTVEQKREREIIKKRFGLFGRRETLEQVGEQLDITRERIRQIQCSIMANLKYNPRNHELHRFEKFEKIVGKFLKELGNVAQVKDLGAKLSSVNDHIHQAQLVFLAHLSPKFAVIPADNHHHQGIALADVHDHQGVKNEINQIVRHITEVGEPLSATDIHQKFTHLHHSQHAHALATLSKKLSHLNKRWGLNEWPSVNPKNIRDKIYIVLNKAEKPMHFREIARSISQGDFTKKQVTIQAIHNELIKDNRFVLIGRGIYALTKWGYKRGTVTDVIVDILKETGTPMNREDIIKRVLQVREVKQTTILLNLQCKPIFKKLSDGRYILKNK